MLESRSWECQTEILLKKFKNLQVSIYYAEFEEEIRIINREVQGGRQVRAGSSVSPVTVYRRPIRLPASHRWLDRSSIPVGRTFFVKNWIKRKPHLRAKMGLCGERKLNLLNIKMMLEEIWPLTKINEIGVAGRYPGAHTLLMSGGDERFHTKAV